MKHCAECDEYIEDVEWNTCIHGHPLVSVSEPSAPDSVESPSTGSVTWDEAVRKLRNCDCGCPIFEFTDDTRTEDWQRFAECQFCGWRTESHWEPQVVLDHWNNRGGKCLECGVGVCQTDDDELCDECWGKSKSPNKEITCRTK